MAEDDFKSLLELIQGILLGSEAPSGLDGASQRAVVGQRMEIDEGFAGAVCAVDATEHGVDAEGIDVADDADLLCVQFCLVELTRLAGNICFSSDSWILSVLFHRHITSSAHTMTAAASTPIHTHERPLHHDCFACIKWLAPPPVPCFTECKKNDHAWTSFARTTLQLARSMLSYLSPTRTVVCGRDGNVGEVGRGLYV